jgi:signal transduction histidine kinase
MTRGRLALLIGVPVFIFAVGQVAAMRAARVAGGTPREQLDARAAVVGGKLGEVILTARQAAEAARDRGPETAGLALPSQLATRLEGAGVVRNGRYESWSGTPAEPMLFGEPGGSRVVSRGIRTSLLISTPADPSGRVGVASFTLEMGAGAPDAEALLPPDQDGIVARWDLEAVPAVAPRFAPGPPARLIWPWLDARGTPIATLVFEVTPASVLAARARAILLAWAGLALAALAVVALARRPGHVDGRRLAALTVGVVVARFALVAARTLEELLPRALGSPSFYGRGDGWGLLSSPAGLLVTAACAAVVLTAVAHAITGAPAATRRRLLVPAAVLTLVAAGGIVALAGSLARDARVPVPRLDPTAAGTFVLAAAAACLLVGAAELSASVAAAARAAAFEPPRAGRLAVAAALVPLSLLFLAQLYRTSNRMIDERLRSEFAPLVLEQSARRRVALTSAVGAAAASPRLAASVSRVAGSGDPFLAYDLWIDSDLFHEGFASSLDVYDRDGARRGHFGFGLPQVGGERETTPRAGRGGEVPVESESVAAGASMLRVLHAERPVVAPSGEIVGRVTGHVLEDPSNLPFLPATAPYVEALGGSPAPADTPATESPDYVLFDADGSVTLSTVRQPPTPTARLREAGAGKRAMTLSAGDTRYRALPLADGGRLHLLLAPSPTALGALADVVRLLLLGAGVLALAALARIVAGGGGLQRLSDIVRGSFYRKVLAAVVVASVVPLVALALFLRAYIETRGAASLADSAADLIGAARRVVEDYQSVPEDDPSIPRLRINDEALWWLRNVVGQEIHVYEDGAVAATSKPELFDSALVAKRLPGEVDRDVVRGGKPVLVRTERLGSHPLPVAYARLTERGGPRDAVIAVPLVLEQRAFARSVDRLVEMLLLLTTALVLLLAASAAWIARSVADPVRRLADASRRIAGGEYGVRLVSTSRDEMGSLVTDFNRMAAALSGQRADLERRRDYIEALLRHATTGVVSTDPAGRVVTINPAAASLLAGERGAPELGRPLEESLRASERTAPLATALAGASSSSSAPREVDLGSGEQAVRLRVVRVPLPDPYGGEAGTLLLLDDVTSLMKGNQLAAWAEMARAIAHEIKNPLTPIQLSTEHVRKLLADRGILPVPEIDACLDTIVRNVKELRDISGAFSTYARIPELTLSPVDPEAFLHEIAAPYRAAPPPSVSIVERHDGAPPILADTKILARAVVNLIENAIQAMPHGGTLTIGSHSAATGEVVLTVSDTGSGLSADARARLFEPYFSTKSSGTGLGLAIARRVVLGHGGAIDVASEPGRGTTFSIRLRAAAGILRA